MARQDKVKRAQRQVRVAQKLEKRLRKVSVRAVGAWKRAAKAVKTAYVRLAKARMGR